MRHVCFKNIEVSFPLLLCNLVLCPDPIWSGDIGLIPRASLLSGEKFPSANHIAENTVCSCNIGKPWLLQHNDTALFWLVRQLSVLNYANSKLWILIELKESAECHQTLSPLVGQVLKPIRCTYSQCMPRTTNTCGLLLVGHVLLGWSVDHACATKCEKCEKEGKACVLRWKSLMMQPPSNPQ